MSHSWGGVNAAKRSERFGPVGQLAGEARLRGGDAR